MISSLASRLSFTTPSRSTVRTFLDVCFVSPYLHVCFVNFDMENAGKLSFTWFGPTPRVVITDPELAREVLTNKCGDFVKSMLSPLSKVLVAGLVVLDGEKWAKHRRILNPAFHAEKLKVLIILFRQMNLDSNFICDA